MGDTRIDGSTPRTTPECDEETGICGAVKKPEPEVGVSFDYLYEDQSHVVPDPKPAHVAEIAKNMSTPKPPTDVDAAPSKPPADTSTSIDPLYAGQTKGHFGVEAGFGVQRGGDKTILEGGVELSTRHVGPKLTGYHEEQHTTVHGADVSVTTDAGTAAYGWGFENGDGSTGLHVGGTGTVGGAEVTLKKEGLGSATLGGGLGTAAQISVGVKKDGNTHDVCARVDTPVITVGGCFPVWFRGN